MKKDIFKLVKKQLPAREVVQFYLGEPQSKSGKTWKWTSPFRKPERTPSLCAEDECINDFGGDFKGDIFSFIEKLKEISTMEALQLIAKDFHVDLTINEFTKTTTNKKYILTPSENTPEEIYCMFDSKGYSKKPTGNEIGQIKNRIPTLAPMTYTIEDIKQAIITGHTCIPTAIKSQNDWKDSESWCQIFMVDIDNVKVINNVKQDITIDDEDHITIDKITAYCGKINLLPTFAYTTFSHTEQHHKLRLVYILNVGTQKQEDIKKIYDFLKETFKDYNIDTAPTSIATMFFGGKEIVYESNIYYEIKKIEETALEIIDNYELSLFNKILKGTPYLISNGKLLHGKELKDSIKYTPVSNFVIYPIEKYNYKNGRDVETFYKMKCVLLDEPTIKLSELIITVEEFQKFNFILGSPWDKYAIINAGSTNADKLREVSQLIGKYTTIEKDIYAHTGFTRVNDKLCYLYHGGIIGDVENIDVDLSNDCLERYCFSNEEFDEKEVLKHSLSILDIASYEITIPLIATTYLAPLTSICKKEGINPDFILFVQGKTGVRKSSLVSATALSHFGKFDRDLFPASFRDTLNSIEKKAFILKDTVLVVDDFNPEVLGSKKLFTMEKLCDMYGDRSRED